MPLEDGHITHKYRKVLRKMLPPHLLILDTISQIAQVSQGMKTENEYSIENFTQEMA